VDDKISYYKPKQIPESCRDDANIAVLNKASKDLVIVFTGMNNKFGVDLQAVYDALPAEKPNFLALADPRQMIYLTGLPAYGRNLEETLEGLKAQVAAWGLTSIYTIGNSGGSYASIYYGVRLGAKRSLAFAPFTCFLPAFEPRSQLFLSKKNRDRDALGRATPELLDLAVAVPRYNQGTEIRIYYAQDHDNDRKHAEHMEDVEGVTVVPVTYSSRHGVVKDMRKQRDLGKVIGKLIDGDFQPLWEQRAAESEMME